MFSHVGLRTVVWGVNNHKNIMNVLYGEFKDEGEWFFKDWWFIIEEYKRMNWFTEALIVESFNNDPHPCSMSTVVQQRIRNVYTAKNLYVDVWGFR